MEINLFCLRQQPYFRLFRIAFVKTWPMKNVVEWDFAIYTIIYTNLLLKLGLEEVQNILIGLAVISI